RPKLRPHHRAQGRMTAETGFEGSASNVHAPALPEGFLQGRAEETAKAVSCFGRSPKPACRKAGKRRRACTAALPSSVIRRSCRFGLHELRAAAIEEDVVERGPDADRQRAGEDGRLAEARGLDPRGIRHPARKQRAHRLEEEVAVRAEATAQDD